MSAYAVSGKAVSGHKIEGKSYTKLGWAVKAALKIWNENSTESVIVYARSACTKHKAGTAVFYARHMPDGTLKVEGEAIGKI